MESLLSPNFKDEILVTESVLGAAPLGVLIKSKVPAGKYEGIFLFAAQSGHSSISSENSGYGDDSALGPE